LKDVDLLEAFVASFATHDEMSVVLPDLDPAGWALRRGKAGRLGARWRPKRVVTQRAALSILYSTLPTRLPGLYESLVLTYRWAQVEIGSCALLANPPGRGLGGLLAEITKDPAFVATLLPKGFIPFARGSGGEYDPVCFDTASSPSPEESHIVQLEHEDILCHGRITVVSEVAPSFRSLVLQAIGSSVAAV
jgi:hypothetical protein